MGRDSGREGWSAVRRGRGRGKEQGNGEEDKDYEEDEEEGVIKLNLFESGTVVS